MPFDSDDKAHPNIFLKLYKSCQKNKTDVAICTLYYWRSSRNNTLVRIQDFAADFELQKMNYNLFDGIYHNTAWRKLYRRTLFNNPINRFPIDLYHEDIGFWWLIMAQINEISVVNEPLYYYRQENPNSICAVKDNIRHASDTISSFYYGFINAMNILSKPQKNDFVNAFLNCYLKFVFPSIATPKAKKEHKILLQKMKTADLSKLDPNIKRICLEQVYIPYETAIFQLRFFSHISETKCHIFLRIFEVKLFEVIVGKG